MGYDVDVADRESWGKLRRWWNIWVVGGVDHSPERRAEANRVRGRRPAPGARHHAPRFPSDARLSQIELDYAHSPIGVRPIDIHVDQLRTSMDAGATEAAQIARANDAGRQDFDRNRDQAGTTLGLVAGIDPSVVRLEPGQRSLKATAAFLPGLGLERYRSLEDRARRALPTWTVMLAPPEEASRRDRRPD